jgi:hypothetical protein
MVLCGQDVWLRLSFIDTLYGMYETCITSITSPGVFAQYVAKFVTHFIEEEMDSVLEQCNYWGSHLNPIARKKTVLLLGNGFDPLIHNRLF